MWSSKGEDQITPWAFGNNAVSVQALPHTANTPFPWGMLTVVGDTEIDGDSIHLLSLPVHLVWSKISNRFSNLSWFSFLKNNSVMYWKKSKMAKVLSQRVTRGSSHQETWIRLYEHTYSILLLPTLSFLLCLIVQWINIRYNLSLLSM